MSNLNRDAAVNLLHAIAAGDTEFDVVAPNAVWWVLGLPETPFGEFIEGLRASFRFPGKIEIKGITAEGDRVAIEAVSFYDTTVDRPYHNSYHFLVEFRDGLVIRVKEYCNTAYVNSVFGGDFFGT